MPISTPIVIGAFSQEEFGKVAYEVVGHAFEVHGVLGKKFHEEACIHFFGGKEQCWQFAETSWHGKKTGRQPVKMLSKGISFEITCKRGDLEIYASHLQKIVSNTNLEAMLWANIVSGTVRLERIGK